MIDPFFSSRAFFASTELKYPIGGVEVLIDDETWETGTTQAADLEATNQTLRTENAELRAENEDLSLLAQDYESVLEKVLEGLRVYAVNHPPPPLSSSLPYLSTLGIIFLPQAQIPNNWIFLNIARPRRINNQHPPDIHEPAQLGAGPECTAAAAGDG